MHKYRGKTVTFEKPLFPNYVFLQLLPEQQHNAASNGHVARLLAVHDQASFAQQLSDILRVLELGLDVRVAPEIGPGSRVKIKYGPLRGVDGWVEQRYGSATVLLRLDFIGKAAAVSFPAEELELI